MPSCECLFEKFRRKDLAKHHGNVSINCDVASLFCEVFVLNGPSSASSCLNFNLEANAVHGPFLYVLFRAAPPLPSVIHLALVVGAGRPFRLTFSTTCVEPIASPTSLQLTLPSEERWQYLALDITALLCQHTPPHYTAPAFRGLQGASFGGNLAVRGVYGSRHPLSSHDLPRAMHMPTPRGSTWAETFQWTWLPAPPASQDSSMVDWSVRSMGPEKEDTLDQCDDLKSRGMLVQVSLEDSPSSQVSYGEDDKPDVAQNMEDTGEEPQESRPRLSLRLVLGPGHGSRRPLCAVAAQRVLYSVGEVIVDVDAATGFQRHALGHSGAVVHMAVDPGGRWLATAQRGRRSVVRVWNVATLEPVALLPAGEVRCLAFSASGRTLLVAAPALRRPFRPTVTLWDCSAVEDAKVVPRVQHTTETILQQAIIVPAHEDHFVACCSGTLRFFRVKAGRVHTCPLSPGVGASRPELLCLAVDASCPGWSGEAEPFVFAGGADGCVYRIAYPTRAVVAAYQLHGGPVRCLDVRLGVCVTASDDAFVRVWPTDFRRNFLEAELDSGVAVVSMAPDASVVFTGTVSGEVGLLDLEDRQFRPLARAHTAAITALALRSAPVQLATASRDGSVRLWDCATGQQLSQVDCSCFTAVEDAASAEGASAVTVLEFHPTAPHLVLGFASGHVRALHLDTGVVCAAGRPHGSAAVSCLSFTRDGGWLVSLSSGALCLQHPSTGYQAMKTVPCPTPGPAISIAHGLTRDVVAVVGAEGSDMVTVYDTTDFTAWQPVQTLRVEMAADETVASLSFARADSALIVAGPRSVHEVDLASSSSRRLLATQEAIVGSLQPYPSTCGVVYAVAGAVHTLELERGQPQTFVGHAAPISDVRVHRCEPLTVSVDTAGQICVWRLED